MNNSLSLSTKLTVTLGPAFASKPKSLSQYSEAQLALHWATLSIEELIGQIAFGGLSWAGPLLSMPCYADTAVIKDRYLRQSLIALEWDKPGLTMNQVYDIALDRASEGLLFGYETFNSTSETPRFRVVWQYQTWSEKQATTEIKRLATLLHDSDKHSQSALKYWQGSVQGKFVTHLEV